MENGTYKFDLEMSTPLGKRHGALELMVWKNYLNGYLTMFTRTIPIKGGTVDGSSISFHGDMITLMNTLPYQAQGNISASHVELEIQTDRGKFPARGVLTEIRKD